MTETTTNHQDPQPNGQWFSVRTVTGKRKKANPKPYGQTQRLPEHGPEWHFAGWTSGYGILCGNKRAANQRWDGSLRTGTLPNDKGSRCPHCIAAYLREIYRLSQAASRERKEAQ